jgi:hypothetical protein
MSGHEGSKYQEALEDAARRANPEGTMPYAQATPGPMPTPTPAPRTVFPLLGVDFCPLDSQSTGDITEVLGEVMTSLRRLPPHARERVLAAATTLVKPDPSEY